MDSKLLGLLFALLPIAVVLLLFPKNADSTATVAIPMAQSPQRLNRFDIVVLYIKTILKLLPGYSPPLRPNAERNGFTFPQISAQGKLDISDEDIRRFQKAVREEDKDGNPMLMIALTLPLLVNILTHRSCPIKPLGSVNTRNVFKLHDPPLCHDWEKLQEATKRDQITYQAMFGGPHPQNAGIRKKRGVEFCIRIIIFYEGRPILEQEVWCLQFLPSSTQPKWHSVAEEPKINTSQTAEVETETISMDRSDPHRWAASCKDYNPIHVSALGSKLFGFPSVIAHGNHVVLLVIEQLKSSNLPGTKDSWSLAQRLCWDDERPFALEVRFVRPLTLPANADVRWQHSESEKEKADFQVSKKGKVCLEGSVCAAADR